MNTNLLCHCGDPAIEGGNGLADICLPCYQKWVAEGEPEDCSCPKFDLPAPNIIASGGKVEEIIYG